MAELFSICKIIAKVLNQVAALSRQPDVWSSSDNSSDLPLPLSHNVLLLITINDVLLALREGNYSR